jgi:general secretion pathway protein F
LRVCERLDLGASSRAALDTARSHIARGKAASQAFSAAGLTDPITERLLMVGERTGAFDAVLQTIAERHAQAFGTFVERATRLLEPLLLLAVAVVVGGIVVMMYMPIFDIAGGLGAAR